MFCGIVTEQVPSCDQRKSLKGGTKNIRVLEKVSQKRIAINPNPPKIHGTSIKEKIKSDLGEQYKHFKEEIDPRFHTPKFLELQISIFVDADHGHDKTTGRSITVIIAMIG